MMGSRVLRTVMSSCYAVGWARGAGSQVSESVTGSKSTERLAVQVRSQLLYDYVESDLMITPHTRC